jgi:ubiquinone/menaquinone biosynthesis C-methylase UbiE
MSLDLAGGKGGATTAMATASFDRVAWFYEQAANVYSFGLNPASKASQLPYLKAEQRVLYAGSGTGLDALAAARLGCQVTCLDNSPKMLDRARARFDAAGLSGEFLLADAFEHQQPAGYDVVVANYFLNTFGEDDMRRLLMRLSELLAPGGTLLVADVAPAQGNLLGRLVNRLHVRIPFYVFWLLGLIPYKPTYDYRAYLAEAGLALRRLDWFRLFRFGPVCYQSLVAERRG